MKVIRVLVYESDDPAYIGPFLRRRTTKVTGNRVTMKEAACYEVPTEAADSVIRILSVIKKVLALIGKPTTVASSNENWWES